MAYGFSPWLAYSKAEIAWWRDLPQRKAVHIVVARNQRAKGGPGEGETPF